VGASGSAGGAGGCARGSWVGGADELVAQELERIQASGARRVVASPSGGRLQERAGAGQGPGEAQASPNELAASGARLGRVSGGWSTDDGGRRASAQRTGVEAGRQAEGAREQGARTAQSVWLQAARVSGWRERARGGAWELAVWQVLSGRSRAGPWA
jgi:hypothetical protein